MYSGNSTPGENLTLTASGEPVASRELVHPRAAAEETVWCGVVWCLSCLCLAGAATIAMECAGEGRSELFFLIQGRSELAWILRDANASKHQGDFL